MLEQNNSGKTNQRKTQYIGVVGADIDKQVEELRENKFNKGLEELDDE